MSVSKSARCLSWAAAWLVLSAPVVAQPANPSAALDPVIVTATGYAQPLVDAIAHSTVLTREDIERSQALDLPALLAREAGLQMSRSGGRGATTTLFLRGAPSSQVLLLVDGVPQTRQDATGSLGIEHLMLDQVERVEVVRGNVSAIYGSGAIGGVIQVFTRRGGSATAVDASVEGGSYDFWRAALNASGPIGDSTRFSVGAAAQGTRGFSAQDPARNPAINPDDDGYRNASGTASLTQVLAAGHTLAFDVTTSDGKVDYDSALASAIDTQQSRTRITTAKVASDNRFADGWQSRLAYGWEQDDSHVVESGAFGYTADYVSGNQLLNWSNRFDLNADWKLGAGLELQRQTIDTDDGFGGVYSKSRRIGSVFGGLQGNVGAFSLQANARYDDIQDTGRQTTGYLGGGWQFAPQWKLSASASNAFNAPPLGYLYAPFFGNPDLKPEEATSYELGLQFAADNQRVRATLFRSRVHNEFVYDLQTNKFVSVGRSANDGLELGYSGVVGRTELAASLTLQDPVNEDTDTALPRRSKTLASASLWQPVGDAKIGLQWNYVGPRDDIGGVRLSSYSLFDILAQWQIDKHFQLFGRVENLFDKAYETADGYPQAGLSAFIGLRWKL